MVYRFITYPHVTGYSIAISHVIQTTKVLSQKKNTPKGEVLSSKHQVPAATACKMYVAEGTHKSNLYKVGPLSDVNGVAGPL